MNVYSFTARGIDGCEVALSDYAGKVALIVNTASHCGFTAQYEGLEDIYRRYHAQGLVVLAFPCNQFGAQEPGSADEIAAFCTTRFQVSFPLFDKIDVNGANQHPLYAHLKSAQKGILGTEAIKWNFTKFLVDRDGAVVDRYAPTTTPQSLAADIEACLAKTTTAA